MLPGGPARRGGRRTVLPMTDPFLERDFKAYERFTESIEFPESLDDSLFAIPDESTRP